MRTLASDLAEHAGPHHERIPAWAAGRLGGPEILPVDRAVAVGFPEPR